MALCFIYTYCTVFIITFVKKFEYVAQCSFFSSNRHIVLNQFVTIRSDNLQRSRPVSISFELQFSFWFDVDSFLSIVSKRVSLYYVIYEQIKALFLCYAILNDQKQLLLSSSRLRLYFNPIYTVKKQKYMKHYNK